MGFRKGGLKGFGEILYGLNSLVAYLTMVSVEVKKIGTKMFQLFFHNNKKMSSSLKTQREMSSLRHPSIKLSICKFSL